MLTCVHARMSASVHAHAAVCARHARAEVAEPAKHMARVSLPPQKQLCDKPNGSAVTGHGETNSATMPRGCDLVLPCPAIVTGLKSRYRD